MLALLQGGAGWRAVLLPQLLCDGCAHGTLAGAQMSCSRVVDHQDRLCDQAELLQQACDTIV